MAPRFRLNNAGRQARRTLDSSPAAQPGCRRAASIAVSLLLLLSPALLLAESTPKPAAKPDQPHPLAIPDLSGLWGPRPGGGGFASWDPNDVHGLHPEALPMLPWAREKTIATRGPYGASATFNNINDPVQKFCDPPGLTRIYQYPWEFRIVQTPAKVYLLFEFFRVFREVALNQPHTADPDPTWYGESVGHFEGDTLVIDTIGFNDKTWLDHVGHPHTEALHTIERFRRLDPKTLELSLTIDDPKAYPRPFTSKRLFQATDSPMGDSICAISEFQSFQKDVINPTTTAAPNK